MTRPSVGVKICGLSEGRGFDAAIEAGADWVGFVFFAGSPRAVTPSQAAVLSARHPGADRGGAKRIGLFVGADDATIARCLKGIALDGLQLYDTVERASAIAARFGLPVWLACAVSDPGDLPASVPGIAGLIIESRPPPGSGRPGGNGVVLDWALLAGWAAPSPWLLAGGLDVGNVGEAIRRSGARAVDVSSGVESRPGVKDPGRIAAFIAAARAATTDSVA